VVLLAVAAFVVMRARGPQVQVVAATRLDLEQHLVASGHVWVPTRVQVSAQTSGRVLSVAVREGQRVKGGDLLLQLDDSEARAAAAQAQAAVDQAGARVEQLRQVGAIVADEELRQAQTGLESAQADFDRIEQLAATGAVNQAEFDNARREVDLALARQTAAEARQLSAAPLGADSRIVLTSLLQAQAELAAANARLTQMKIVALQNAVVLTRSVEPGNVVPPSQTLLVLAADNDTAQIVFQSDERNLAAIRIGQKARVSADAYPQQSFEASVSYIAPSIDPGRGSIEVRLRLPDPPAFLKPDMTVSVDLTVAAKQNVLTIPADAVHGAATSQPWVLVVEGRQAVRRDVTLGIRGEGTVEVMSNLDEGVEVILPDGRTLTAGQRVRPVRRGP
jgi:HlyD family secretion protein